MSLKFVFLQKFVRSVSFAKNLMILSLLQVHLASSFADQNTSKTEIIIEAPENSSNEVIPPPIEVPVILERTLRSPIPSNRIPNNRIPNAPLSGAATAIPRNSITDNKIPRKPISRTSIPSNQIPRNRIPSNRLPRNSIPRQSLPRNSVRDDRKVRIQSQVQGNTIQSQVIEE